MREFTMITHVSFVLCSESNIYLAHFAIILGDKHIFRTISAVLWHNLLAFCVRISKKIHVKISISRKTYHSRVVWEQSMNYILMHCDIHYYQFTNMVLENFKWPWPCNRKIIKCKSKALDLHVVTSTFCTDFARRKSFNAPNKMKNLFYRKKNPWNKILMGFLCQLFPRTPFFKTTSTNRLSALCDWPLYTDRRRDKRCRHCGRHWPVVTWAEYM